MPETRTVKGFSEVLLPLAEGDFESSGKNRTWRNLTEDNGGGKSGIGKRDNPTDTCLSTQDTFKKYPDYFKPLIQIGQNTQQQLPTLIFQVLPEGRTQIP